MLMVNRQAFSPEPFTALAVNVQLPAMAGVPTNLETFLKTEASPGVGESIVLSVDSKRIPGGRALSSTETTEPSDT
jgi:hypothetical protein